MTYLFDTDVLSNLLKRRPSGALQRRTADVPRSEQFTSAVTIGELVYGAHKAQPHTDRLLQRQREVLQQVISVVPFDEAAARHYGELRADLERKGTPLAEPDLRIASVALAHDLTLITGNTRHFDRVPGLRVENWLE